MRLKQIGTIAFIFTILCGQNGQKIIEQSHCCTIPTILSSGHGPDMIESNEGKDKWDIAENHGPTKVLSFTTSEGTWMSLDVSPDGKEIIFDLLGDLYTMPVNGGTATPITTGPAWDIPPAFSPIG